MIEFTEQEILQDALVAQKFMIHMYCQFGLECSNECLRKMFNEHHAIAMEHNFKIFNIMHDLDFYPTTIATSKDIKSALKMYTQMQTELEQKLNK